MTYREESFLLLGLALAGITGLLVFVTMRDSAGYRPVSASQPQQLAER